MFKLQKNGNIGDSFKRIFFYTKDYINELNLRFIQGKAPSAFGRQNDMNKHGGSIGLKSKGSKS